MSADAHPQPIAAAAQAILLRDLRGLERQLNAYESDDSLWTLAPGISNAAGTLILHVSGNVQHFIGAVLGQGGYVRDRDAEFARRDASREELRAGLHAAKAAVESVLPRLTAAQIESEFPVPIAGKRIRTSDFLAHLVAHLAYHLGQVDFHRRLLHGGGALDVVSPAELPQLGG